MAGARYSLFEAWDHLGLHSALQSCGGGTSEKETGAWSRGDADTSWDLVTGGLVVLILLMVYGRGWFFILRQLSGAAAKNYTGRAAQPSSSPSHTQAAVPETSSHQEPQKQLVDCQLMFLICDFLAARHIPSECSQTRQAQV